MELADEVEQQLAAGAGEREVAELVEHDDLEPGELIGEFAGLAKAALLLEAVTKSTMLK